MLSGQIPDNKTHKYEKSTSLVIAQYFVNKSKPFLFFQRDFDIRKIYGLSFFS
jgi:hypothetical protein